MKTTYLVIMAHQDSEPFMALCRDREHLELRIKSWMFAGTQILHTGSIDAVYKIPDITARLRHQYGVKTVTTISEVKS